MTQDITLQLHLHLHVISEGAENANGTFEARHACEKVLHALRFIQWHLSQSVSHKDTRKMHHGQQPEQFPWQLAQRRHTVVDFVTIQA
jgi:hypothetical protein